jgi:hypothetical protein
MSRSTNADYWGIAEPEEAYTVAFWKRDDKKFDVRVYVFDGFDLIDKPISGFVYDPGITNHYKVRASALVEAIALGVISPYSLRDKTVTFDQVSKLLSKDDLEVIFGSCRGYINGRIT